MDKLSDNAYQEAQQAIMEDGRPLEQALFRYYFEQGSTSQILYELEQFQNDNGGFGNALEPDFRLPASNAADTAIALQILVDLEEDDDVESMAAKAISYLESTYDEERNGWYNVPEDVNRFPRGPWWTFDKEIGHSPLDHHWGNPNAELAGYVYTYQDHVDNIDVDDLVEHAIDYLYQLSSYESEHEVYSFIRLYNLLPDELKEKMETKLILAVDEIVVLNSNEWGQYVPKPLDIVESPDSNYFGLFKNAVEDNLQFLIKSLEEKGRMSPTWAWSGYEEKWEEAQKEWVGILTLDALKKLDNFDMI